MPAAAISTTSSSWTRLPTRSEQQPADVDTCGRFAVARHEERTGTPGVKAGAAGTAFGDLGDGRMRLPSRSRVQRLAAYGCTSTLEEDRAIREITQEVVLAALARTDFFRHAAFQGGTCLRILHGLARSPMLSRGGFAAGDRPRPEPRLRPARGPRSTARAPVRGQLRETHSLSRPWRGC